MCDVDITVEEAKMSYSDTTILMATIRRAALPAPRKTEAETVKSGEIDNAFTKHRLLPSARLPAGTTPRKKETTNQKEKMKRHACRDKRDN